MISSTITCRSPIPHAYSGARAISTSNMPDLSAIGDPMTVKLTDFTPDAGAVSCAFTIAIGDSVASSGRVTMQPDSSPMPDTVLDIIQTLTKQEEGSSS